MVSQQKSQYDAVIIGGGFFGCKVALYLKQYCKRILILEKESDLLQRASYINQARVHNGYHYPRSILTAWRSRINFSQFVREYQDCIVSDFDKYYAIGRIFSKVNAHQFKIFCDRIDAPLEAASQDIKKLFNSHLIEEVFRVKEYVFDAVKLKEIVLAELEQEQINIQCNANVTKIEQKNNDLAKIEIAFLSEAGENKISADRVFNCTYSAINIILLASNLPTIPLKHELTEMPLVKVPESIEHLGITVMCGPFFSLMPFPAKNSHTLSHVRYTPHCYWQDTEDRTNPTDKIFDRAVCKSNYPQIIRDATRYLPILQECRYLESLWEIKTVLPQSEIDDSRPILFHRDPTLPNLTCILGGKIDNVYDIRSELNFLDR
jgi:glycine/D-amino acid oxidase-like deaminating enzyme